MRNRTFNLYMFVTALIVVQSCCGSSRQEAPPVVFETVQFFTDEQLATEGTWPIIWGRVLEKKTRNPLPRANVNVPGYGRGAATDQDGKFKFTLPRGKYEFVVSYIGYKDVTQEVSVDEDKVYLRFELSERAIDLGEIKINGSN